MPFEITDEQIRKISLSGTPIPVSAVCENINNVIDCTVFRKVSAVKVTEWLAEKGFLQNIAESKRKTLTDKSALLGITQEERISPYDNKSYIMNLYGREA